MQHQGCTKSVEGCKNFEESIRFLYLDSLERLARTWGNTKPTSGHVFTWRSSSHYLLDYILTRLSITYVDTVYTVVGSKLPKPMATRNELYKRNEGRIPNRKEKKWAKSGLSRAKEERNHIEKRKKKVKISSCRTNSKQSIDIKRSLKLS